jgi:ATP-dependent Clp protease ATP-binding subunit ClpC
MTQLDSLKPGAQLVWAAALQAPARFGHSKTGLYHFLIALLERYGPMAESLASGLDASDHHREIERRLRQDDIGGAIEPDALLEEALTRARAAGKTQVSERDLAAVLLKRDGWNLLSHPAVTVSKPAKARHTPQPSNNVAAAAEAPEASARATDYRPRARHATPQLEQFGRDLCQEALKGELPTILGREAEMEAMMETLCRWTKRNPLLIGPAGVGKTAIVEGLAQRVVDGDVPPPIQGIRIIALQASALVSGAGIVGKLEERMQAILGEASQDGIVLFIDEVHSIVGSGGVRQVSDIGSQLKPALAKGDIACIGATTDAEFHRFIEEDRALERRFQPLRVQELSTDATMTILQSLRGKAKLQRNVEFPQASLDLIILLASQYLRNRHFPDKAIDILEQCTARAVLRSLEEVTPDTVRDVTERMVGMPIDLGRQLTERLGDLRRRLTEEAFCPEAVADQIIERLTVTARGLDVAPNRANAVLLAIAAPGQSPELAAQVLADALYGQRDRLIEVDMTRFTHPADVNWLIGAPPGYVGHDQTLSFQLELAQQPWSVILFKNVDASHPQAQRVLAQALHSGSFTDTREQKVYMSDAVVLLTASAGGPAGSKRSLGFLAEHSVVDGAPTVEEIGSLVIPDLLAEVDASWSPVPLTAGRVETWIKAWILPPLAERYERQGLKMQWDASLVKWLSNEILEAGDLTRGERLLEEKVLPEMIPYLDRSDTVILSYEDDGNVKIQAEKGT